MKTKSPKPTDLEPELAKLRALLEQKDREIKNLTEKVEILNNKIIFFQNECFKVTKLA